LQQPFIIICGWKENKKFTTTSNEAKECRKGNIKGLRKSEAENLFLGFPMPITLPLAGVGQE